VILSGIAVHKGQKWSPGLTAGDIDFPGNAKGRTPLIHTLPATAVAARRSRIDFRPDARISSSHCIDKPPRVELWRLTFGLLLTE
jgi:hypothetical protein